MESKQCQTIEAKIGGNSLGITKKGHYNFQQCPNQNIWIVVLKGHVFQLLKITKPIDNQHMDRL